MKSNNPVDSTVVRAELLQLLGGFMQTQALAVVARLGVADIVDDEPVHVTELAARIGAHPASLHRLLRMLAGIGVFDEVEPGSFIATRLSDGLRTDAPESVHHLAIAFGNEHYQAWGEALYTFQTGLSAFEHLYGEPYFEFLARHPEEGENFDRAMAGGALKRSAALMSSYDLSGISTLADIGGGNGVLLSSVLAVNTHLQGVVFDLPHVAAKAAALIEGAGMGDRCIAVGGDFFSDPLPRADAYVLAHILHDWDDNRALDILRNCRRSAPASGRLLLLENILPEGSQPSWAKQLDLHMLVLLGGKERTESQWCQLLDEADFRLVRVTAATGTHVLEAEPS